MKLTLRTEHDADIARLAVPALGTLVAGPLYVLADTAIVGHLGSAELAGLALATTVILSIHGLLIFLAYGTTSSVSRLIGAGDEKRAALLSIQGLWLAGILGVVLAAAVITQGEQLLRWLGGTGSALEFGERYLLISALGLPFLLLALAGAGAFHGRQDARTPLLVAVATAVINLVIELVAVFALGYGVGASALSTVIAEVVAAGVYGWRVVGWGRKYDLSLRPVWSLILGLARAGKPLILRNVALRGSFTLATAVAARIGVAELGGHQIGLQVWSTLALALDAVAIAGQALTGRWLGAGAVETARSAAARMIQIDVSVGVLMGVLVIASRHYVAQGFSTDAEVIAAAAWVLLWVGLSEPINGYVFALDGILIGAGDYTYLSYSMALAGVGFAVMAGTVLALGLGLGWLWAALSAFMVSRATGLWWRWRSDVWLRPGAPL